MGQNAVAIFSDTAVVTWFSSVIAIAALAALLILFYLYTEKLKPLIGIAPAFIFFLTPRNNLIYAMAFVPLIMLICFQAEDKGHKTSKRKDREH